MAKQQLRGLGKGLSALLGENADLTFRRPVQYVNADGDTPGAVQGGSVCLIPVSQIEANPFQPRVTFDQQALEELAQSIRTLGLIQPITVRKTGEHLFQIISGERRFRASKAAGLQEIPAYVRSTDDAGMLEMAIVENVQRADLDPIETAMSYQRLIDECNLTQEKMAERIGKSRVAVTNCLRLLKLPAKVQYDLKVGNISVGHAKVLLGVDDDALVEQLADIVIREGLSVRALEQRIKVGDLKLKPAKSAQDEIELPDEHYRIAEIIGRYFKNNVSFKRNAEGKGVMTVRFDDDAQVQNFLSALQEKGL